MKHFLYVKEVRSMPYLQVAGKKREITEASSLGKQVHY